MTYVLSVVSVEFQVFSGIMQGERPGHVAETWVNGSSGCIAFPKGTWYGPLGWSAGLHLCATLVWLRLALEVRFAAVQRDVCVFS